MTVVPEFNDIVPKGGGKETKEEIIWQISTSMIC